MSRFDYVKNRVEELGGKLISVEYVSAHSKLTLECPDCLCTFEKSFTHIDDGREIISCSTCSYKRAADNRRKEKPKCSECGKELSKDDAKMCGSCWGSAGIDARKEVVRFSDGSNPAYKSGESLAYWRNKVFRINPNMCDCCGYDGVALVAHHLFSRSKFPELTIEIANGVILCANCHNEFHHHYGHSNTKAEYEEFKKEYK